VHQGGISGIQSFSLGGRAFDHHLSKALKTSLDKAEQIKLDYAAGLLDKKSEAKIKDVMKATASVWAVGVAEALDEFHHLDVLPNRILIGGGGSNLPDLKNILLTKGWANNLPFAKKPYPQLVHPMVGDDVALGEGVVLDQSDMTVLGLVGLTLETDLGEDVVGDVLKRIVLSMQS